VDRIARALAAVAHAGNRLGLRVETTRARATIEGVSFPMVTVDLIAEATARGLAHPEALHVANRITAAARDILRQRGIAFLDERGHLSIRRPPLIIDTEFTPVASTRTTRSRPIDGAALDVAVWLLHRPDVRGVRGIARAINRPVATVSVALARLRREGLLTDRNEPLVPDLFEICAEEWRYRQPTPPIVTANLRALITETSGTMRRQWLEQSLATVTPDVAYAIGTSILSGPDPMAPVNDPDEIASQAAAQWLEIAAKPGNTNAITNLAFAIRSSDPVRSRSLLEQSAAFDDEVALYQLGMTPDTPAAAMSEKDRRRYWSGPRVEDHESLRGVALAGTAAQRNWDVPIIDTSTSTTLWLPDDTSLAIATGLGRGNLARSNEPPIELAVTPIPWLCSYRVSRNGNFVVPAVAVALDLALDPARGRETLDAWKPDGVPRVW
jgi:hypothetical protein